jgi:hypothetical protein
MIYQRLPQYYFHILQLKSHHSALDRVSCREPEHMLRLCT